MVSTPNNKDAFGTDFLPGKVNDDHDGASRAMERSYGGQVGTPFNKVKEEWDNDFSSKGALR